MDSVDLVGQDIAFAPLLLLYALPANQAMNHNPRLSQSEQQDFIRASDQQQSLPCFLLYGISASQHQLRSNYVNSK